MNKKEIYKKLENWLLNLWKKHNISIDVKTFDLQAEIDFSLTSEENEEIIKEKLLQLGYLKPYDLMSAKERQDYKEKTEREKQEQQKQELKRINKLQEQSFNRIIKTKQANTVRFFYEVKNYIKMVAKDFSKGLVLKGSGGFGKSFAVMTTLNELGLKINEDYVLINAYITPLSFYETLFNYRDKIIVLDDSSGILNNEKSLTILKNALWSVSDVRTVSYLSTTDKLNVESSFEFTGRIIVCCNKLNEKDLSVSALKTRCLFQTVEFSYKDKLEILAEISKIPYKELTDRERLEIIKFIKENSDETTSLNIRTLRHLQDIYSYCKKTNEDFSKIALKQLVNDNILSIAKICESKTDIQERNKFWQENTDMTLRSLQRYLGKLRILRGEKRQTTSFRE